MNEFLTELKELLQKHDAYIHLDNEHESGFAIMNVHVGEELKYIDDEYLDVEYIRDVLKTTQPKLSRNLLIKWTNGQNVTVKNVRVDDTGETIVTFEEIGNVWKYSQLQTLGLVE